VDRLANFLGLLIPVHVASADACIYIFAAMFLTLFEKERQAMDFGKLVQEDETGQELDLRYKHGRVGIVRDDDLAALQEFLKLQRLILPSTITDAGLLHLKPLTQLRALTIEDAPGIGVSRYALANALQGMSQLLTLNLSQTAVNNRSFGSLTIDYNGTQEIWPLRSLQDLSLDGTMITTGVRGFQRLPALETLSLASTSITEDDIFGALDDLPALKSLDITNTKVRRRAVEDIRRTRPGLIVYV
jgi:hypothetical protein